MASKYQPLSEQTYQGGENFNPTAPPPTYFSVPQPTPQQQTLNRYEYPQSQYGQVASQAPQYPSLPVTAQPQTTYQINTTRVITSQPGRMWRAGLCDCCNDCNVCMCTFCCGSCYACALATRMNESCCVGFCPSGPLVMRTKFRYTHNIEGSLLEDICVSCFCNLCVVCQLGREMNAENYPKSGCCDC